MNNNPTSNIVSVLKQKMTDTRDEVAKYKEKILDLENSMQAEVDRKEIATTEACRLNERMAVLEEKLAEVKDATRTANEKTAELSKTGEEAIRQAKVMKNTTNAEDEKQSLLEAELKRAQQVENESSQKYDEVSKKILAIESKLEEVEINARKHEKVKLELELEDELRILSNNLKSLECAKDKS